MQVLDSRKLYYFRAVARARSFRAAASVLGISQSVLTRQIQSLEEELSIVLLHRGGRTTRTTEGGDLLLDRCTRILEDLDETRALLSSLGFTPVGTVTLAMLTSFSASFSAAILNDALEALPNVRLRTTEGTSRYVEERLLAGSAEIGIFIKRPLADQFILEDLLHEEFRLFGRRLPEGTKGWTMGEIARLPLVLPPAPHGTRRLLDEAARREKIGFAPRFEVDSPHLIRDLLLASGVYAILPGTALKTEQAAGLIQSAPIINPPKRTVVMGTLAGHPLSTAARATAQFIRRTVMAHREAP